MTRQNGYKKDWNRNTDNGTLKENIVWKHQNFQSSVTEMKKQSYKTFIYSLWPTPRYKWQRNCLRKITIIVISKLMLIVMIKYLSSSKNLYKCSKAHLDTIDTSFFLIETVRVRITSQLILCIIILGFQDRKINILVSATFQLSFCPNHVLY